MSDRFKEATSSGPDRSTKQKSKPSIRHVEKRRTSTCKFADRVAKVSVEHFRKHIPQDPKIPTCLATIVAHFRGDDNSGENGKLQVLGLGVGTKFLSESHLREEEQSTPYGKRVRDCHAEVLARRAFRRYLTDEIIKDSKEKTANGTKDDSNSSLQILTRSSPNPLTGNMKYKLKAGITLHMYTSSAPCGNATLKKFGKMQRERFRDDLGPDEWPTGSHIPIHGHSIRLGQFALLVKKDNTGNLGSELATTAKDNVSNPEAISSKKRPNPSVEPMPTSSTPVMKRKCNNAAKGKAWPATTSDDWCPPGTSIVSLNKGSIHTCSDKLCRWNVLGVQGALLACLLESPLYISTLTVGRKLTEIICRRAVCCRIGIDETSKEGCCDAVATSKTVDNSRLFHQTKVDPSLGKQQTPPTEGNTAKTYRLNHPTIMATSVYMDETGVIEMKKETELGQDVRFHSSHCWVWWASVDNDDAAAMFPMASKISDTHDDSTKITKHLECIDGFTGFAVPIKSNPIALALSPADTVTTGTESQVSTFALMESFKKLYCSGQSKVLLENVSVNVDDSGQELVSAVPPNSLGMLLRWKKEVSPEYEGQKEILLSKHRILRQWKRREAGHFASRTT